METSHQVGKRSTDEGHPTPRSQQGRHVAVVIVAAEQHQVRVCLRYLHENAHADGSEHAGQCACTCADKWRYIHLSKRSALAP